MPTPRWSKVLLRMPCAGADLIVMDQDILEPGDNDADKMGDTKVLETWFMGKKVYSAKAQ
jgi:predicted amidohydrolase YtcJ